MANVGPGRYVGSVVFVMVLAAEADETRQDILVLIAVLVGIAVLLAALTMWYWIMTNPKRRRPSVPASWSDGDGRGVAAITGQIELVDPTRPAPSSAGSAEPTRDQLVVAGLEQGWTAVVGSPPLGERVGAFSSRSGRDELAAARERREGRGEGLSNDEWSAVIRSVFDRYRS